MVRTAEARADLWERKEECISGVQAGVPSLAVASVTGLRIRAIATPREIEEEARKGWPAHGRKWERGQQGSNDGPEHQQQEQQRCICLDWCGGLCQIGWTEIGMNSETIHIRE